MTSVTMATTYRALSKGVCRLSVVPVRAEAADQSEQVTQLLFGDHYTIIDVSESGKWLKIKIYFDDYEGWIDAKQHYPVSDEYFEQINNSDYKITLDYTSNILFKKKLINIVIGSVLPIATNELFKMEEQLAFNGESKSLNQRREYDFIKVIAFRYINSPYLWGGKSPFGIDCSGFTQQVFKIGGYRLPRDSKKQADQGEKIEGLDQARPGDLVFFSHPEGRINHVGILLEDNEIIHASGQVRVDKVDDKGIYVEQGAMYTHKLAAVKRIIK